MRRRSGPVICLLERCSRAELARAFTGVSSEFSKISVQTLTDEHRKIWAGSEEENSQPIDGSGLVAAGTPGRANDGGLEGHHRARSVFSGSHRQGGRWRN